MAWEPVNNVAGYRVYVRSSGAYGGGLEAGGQQPPGGDGLVRYRVGGLTPGINYFFAVTSYDEFAKESGLSNELSISATPAPTNTQPRTPIVLATNTRTPTRTPTRTLTHTPTRTRTPSLTPTSRVTRTATGSPTPRRTPTVTPVPKGLVDLTSLGRIVVPVPQPRGAGSRNLEVIRDGFVPRNSSALLQYDSWDGANSSSIDYVGYEFPRTYLLSHLLFQEGRHFSDGGWFDTVVVQVRQDGVWTTLTDADLLPHYERGSGSGFKLYGAGFAPVFGDGVRLFGSPGGSADFISVAELRVYGPPASTGSSIPISRANTATTPTPTPTWTPRADGAGAQISGQIRVHADGTALSDVEVEAFGTVGGAVLTDSSGLFAFAEASGDGQLILPRKQDQARRRISPLDAVAVLQAVAGIDVLSDHQRLACDVTGEGTLSAADAQEILDYRIGRLDRVAAAERCASDWLFVPVPAPLPDQFLFAPHVTADGCHAGAIALNPLHTRAPGQDFEGIRFGDCAQPAATRNRNRGKLAKPDATVVIGAPEMQGRSITVPLYVDSAEAVHAIEARARFDDRTLRFSSARLAGASDGSVFAITEDGPGRLNLAAAGAQPLTARHGAHILLRFVQTAPPSTAARVRLSRSRINDRRARS